MLLSCYQVYITAAYLLDSLKEHPSLKVYFCFVWSRDRALLCSVSWPWTQCTSSGLSARTAVCLAAHTDFMRLWNLLSWVPFSLLNSPLHFCELCLSRAVFVWRSSFTFPAALGKGLSYTPARHTQLTYFHFRAYSLPCLLIHLVTH